MAKEVYSVWLEVFFSFNSKSVHVPELKFEIPSLSNFWSFLMFVKSWIFIEESVLDILTFNIFLYYYLVRWNVNYLLPPECISLNRHLFIEEEKYFLWHDIISFERKPFIFTECHSLGHDTVHLTGNNFISQEIIQLNLIRLYISWERRDCCQVFRLRLKDFVGNRFPGTIPPWWGYWLSLC